MQQSGGLLLAAGWTAATPLFLPVGQKCKRVPFAVPKKDGLERAAPVRTLVQKLRAGEQFLARGRVHRRKTHPIRDVGFLLFLLSCVLRKSAAGAGLTATTPLFSFTESERKCKRIPFTPLLENAIQKYGHLICVELSVFV